MRRALVATSIILLNSRATFAQAPSTSLESNYTEEELIEKGVALRRQGLDSDALRVFERAYALGPSFRALAQIALAQQALANWREAERGLNEVLRNADDQWVARYRVLLDESLAAVQSHLAWLEVESNVAQAEIWVGSDFAGRLPLEQPIRVAAGEADVRVSAPGYPAIRRTLQIGGKSRVHAVFTFLTERPVVVPSSEHELAIVGAQPHSSRLRVGWTVLAGAGGLFLTGAVALAVREWEARLYDYDSQCAPSAGQSRYDRCGTNRDIGSVAQTIALLAFVASGTAASLSGALLLSRSQPTVPARRQLACGFAGIGLGCEGWF